LPPAARTNKPIKAENKFFFKNFRFFFKNSYLKVLVACFFLPESAGCMVSVMKRRNTRSVLGRLQGPWQVFVRVKNLLSCHRRGNQTKKSDEIVAATRSNQEI
jgi:hypothetical protein